MQTIKASLLDPIHLVLKKPIQDSSGRLYVELEPSDFSLEVLEINDKKLNGHPCIRGTRIPIVMIMDYILNGYSVKEIVKVLPSVSEEKVRHLFEFFKKLFKTDTHETAS